MNRLGRWTPALLIAAAVLISSRAAAQACADGRVVGPDTQGHCCWPGQSWSAEASRCEGPPQCPQGLAGAGDMCVPAADAAPQTQLSPPIPPAAPPSSQLAWPFVPTDIGVGVVNPRVLSSNGDAGLVISGITLLGVGYLAAILAGAFDQTQSNCYNAGGYYGGYPGTCDTWALGFVPLGGGVLAGTIALSGKSRYAQGWGWALGLPGGVVQSVGLTLLIVGILVHHEELVPSMETGGARIQILPYASASAAGVSLTVEL